jgi:hypothetical protein
MKGAAALAIFPLEDAEVADAGGAKAELSAAIVLTAGGRGGTAFTAGTAAGGGRGTSLATSVRVAFLL